jgi:hypothetical protein
MDFSALKRDPEAVGAAVVEAGEQLVCAKPIKVVFPERYAERGLASLIGDKFVLGMFAMVSGDSYGVFKACVLVPMTPTEVERIKINGDYYVVFSFDAGAVMVPNANLVKVDTVTYQINDEFISKGKMPFFFNYEDAQEIFVTAKSYADANIGLQREVDEMIISIIARSPQDVQTQFRMTVNNLDEAISVVPSWVPLMSIRHTASNTVTKLAGSYFSKGVVSALLNPSERVERIESLLR